MPWCLWREIKQPQFRCVTIIEVSFKVIFVRRNRKVENVCAVQQPAYEFMIGNPNLLSKIATAHFLDIDFIAVNDWSRYVICAMLKHT